MSENQAQYSDMTSSDSVNSYNRGNHCSHLSILIQTQLHIDLLRINKLLS